MEALRTVPSFDEEAALWAQGYRCIAGLDEVGRGPLAGPVVAAAVVLYPVEDDLSWLADVRDSKTLSARQRERLDELIRRHAFGVGVGVVSPTVIDRDGIVPASRWAMLRAMEALPCAPDHLLIDGRERVATNVPQKAVIRGDGSIISVAAASIVAKVYRDRLMERLDACCTGWGFSQHKGYATAMHLQLLQERGPSPAHRRSFAPSRQLRLGPTIAAQ